MGSHLRILRKNSASGGKGENPECLLSTLIIFNPKCLGHAEKSKDAGFKERDGGCAVRRGMSKAPMP